MAHAIPLVFLAEDNFPTLFDIMTSNYFFIEVRHDTDSYDPVGGTKNACTSSEFSVRAPQSVLKAFSGFCELNVWCKLQLFNDGCMYSKTAIDTDYSNIVQSTQIRQHFTSFLGIIHANDHQECTRRS